MAAWPAQGRALFGAQGQVDQAPAATETQPFGFKVETPAGSQNRGTWLGLKA